DDDFEEDVILGDLDEEDEDLSEQAIHEARLAGELAIADEDAEDEDGDEEEGLHDVLSEEDENATEFLQINPVFVDQANVERFLTRLRNMIMSLIALCWQGSRFNSGDTSMVGVYLDILTKDGLTASEWFRLYVGSTVVSTEHNHQRGLWKRIGTYFRWVKRRDSGASILEQGVHARAILEPGTRIQFVKLAKFSDDIPKIYVHLLETLMMIFYADL
ncbi:MAG: hypothetical protein LQ341_007524, partial [Variospora aurantia]